ncbi:MAG: Smr/MutS family protein [Rhodobacteraceae bacterium]|nr:Smr/MutS family protein [Paracoccaceae bacterium]
MGSRVLTEEDFRQWQQVERTAKPLPLARRRAAVRWRNAPPLAIPGDRAPEAAPNIKVPLPASAAPSAAAGVKEGFEIEPFEIGSKAQQGGALWPSCTSANTAPTTRGPIRLDDKTNRKMKRGRLQPEARLDLHGLTLEEARPVLCAFINRARESNKRLVLVITGKGDKRLPASDQGPIPAACGLLRYQVPEWLRMPPLASIILHTDCAHPRHGGAGALYVYLRRHTWKA